MQSTSVVIIGAGLAGLSLASKLHKEGVNVKLFERRDVVAQQGYSLSLKKRGVQALRQITSLERITEFSTSGSRFLMTNTAGKTLMDLKARTSSDYLFVPRAKLHELLLEAVPQSLITWDKMFSSYKRLDNGRLQVSFTDGTAEECDVLVGADGHRSKVRQQLLGDQVQFAGAAQISGTIVGAHNVPNEPPSTLILAQDKPHGMMLFNLANRYSWAYIFKSTEKEFNDMMTSLNEPQLVKHVIEQVRDWSGFDVGKLEQQQANIALRGYYYHPPESLLRLFDEKSRSVWPKDPVIVIGDAAHSMTPMQGEGGNCAIEDGVMVGEALVNILNQSQRPTSEELLSDIRAIHKDVHHRTNNAVNSSAYAASYFFVEGKWKAWARDWFMYSFHLLLKTIQLFRR